MKLLGNCAYGFTVTDKEKYCSVKYVGDDKVSRQINDRFFKDLNELNNDMYEVIKTKSKVTLNLPLQIGSDVYQLAKLRMLQFKYDFIDRFIDQSDYQYCEMDTDSAYIAFSSANIEDIIKPHLRNEYRRIKP